MKHDSWLAATTWEFENRALAPGVLFSVAFMWSAFDPQNVTVALAHALSDRLQADGDRLARTLFALAAVAVSTAALTRTWASAYLTSDVVYASALKTASLVADGQYRHTRNPPYLGNVLMAVGIGAMASRIGLQGRVLQEALANGPAAPPVKVEHILSPVANGRQTLLQYQQLGPTRYIESACVVAQDRRPVACR